MVRRSIFSIIIALALVVSLFGAAQPAHADDYSEKGDLKVCYSFFGWALDTGWLELAPNDVATVSVDFFYGDTLSYIHLYLFKGEEIVSYSEISDTSSASIVYRNGDSVPVRLELYLQLKKAIFTDPKEMTGNWQVAWGDASSAFHAYKQNMSNCGDASSESSSAVTWFNPDDGRADGRPGDRLAAYCNSTANPPSINVYGVEDNSKGVFLATFTNTDLLKAGREGITKAVDGLGTVSMMQDGGNHFYVAWNGGQFKATGQGDFSKSFTCDFAQ